MIALIVIIVVVVLLVVWFLLAYNGLIRRRNQTQEAWSEIDVELKRRHDLIPNLVETVKGYAAHEQGTFTAVTQARANAIGATATGDPAKIGPAENVLTASLKSLFAVAEAYPQLKAVETFLQLQEQLTATEDKLEYARRFYNTSARDFNTKIQSFPGNIVAGVGSFKAFGFFTDEPSDREVPQVSFAAPPPAASLSGPPPAEGGDGPPMAAGGPGGPPLAP